MSKETKYTNLELLRKPIGPIDSELLFELFSSLISIKVIEFALKKTDWLQSELFSDFNRSKLDQSQACYCFSFTKNVHLFRMFRSK